MIEYKYYCYYPNCADSFEKAESIADAKSKIELHEKEFHKGKVTGIFGKGYKG